jgi:hypothetical protein
MPVSLRSALLAAAVATMVSPSICQANFKYIPGPSGSADTGQAPAPQSGAPVSAIAPAVNMREMPPQSPPSGGAVLSPGGGEVIEGFGTNVPLVMALREITPASYQFAFAPGLNLGTLVTWHGGAPWHDVMNGVLQPLGLIARDGGTVIYIDRAPGQ